MYCTHRRPHVVAASFFAVSLSLSSIAAAQNLRGVISQQHDDGTVTVQADDRSTVIVLIADSTKVRRRDGLRSSKTGAGSLIPGLRVEVSGHYDPDSNRLVAKRVTFHNADLTLARAIEAGLGSTDRRVADNEQRIARQEAVLRRQAEQIAANDAKIVATTGKVDAAVSRMSRLDDYNIIGSVTVYFGDGQSDVSAKYRHRLERLIAQAKDVPGYVLQVQGYASDVGAEMLNERLSTDRAVAVTRILQENGIPPTNIAPPAGMGVSSQVAPNKTVNGQAENRRAVVTLLQNKGISGK
jgi:outer membrane protein OmpA-like peptidoglycan-associated protein